MASKTKSPPRRADARRNIETIVAAAERRLARDPDASMSDIASEAGLGRITIYGHFKTRAELVEVVARRVLADANTLLSGVDLRGEPAAALARLVQVSWEVTARSGSLVVAAERALSPQVLRELHAGELEDRVRRFLARCQRERAFRSDLPTNLARGALPHDVALGRERGPRRQARWQQSRGDRHANLAWSLPTAFGV